MTRSAIEILLRIVSLTVSDCVDAAHPRSSVSGSLGFLMVVIIKGRWD
jgi:hypothetical protein